MSFRVVQLRDLYHGIILETVHVIARAVCMGAMTRFIANGWVRQWLLQATVRYQVCMSYYPMKFIMFVDYDVVYD